MSGRRGGNRIRGPQSALTDFLAANNISAAQIRDDYERRRTQQAQEEDTGEGASNQTPQNATATPSAVDTEEEEARTKKRKRAQKNAIEKIKKDKEAKKGKKKPKKKKGSDSDEDHDDYDDEDFAKDMYKKSRPAPGQFEHCEICSKRFTVTPYSVEGPEGGLLCTPCGKEFKKDVAKEKKAAAPKPAGRKRRKLESDRLDGIKAGGSKTLQQLCIEKIAKHHEDVEELGDMPQPILEKLSMIFSKKRVMKSRTLQLFLRPDLEQVVVHDAANLEPEDYQQIFAIVPNMQKLVLGNACQMKDEAVGYMVERCRNINHLQLYAANLISNDMWDMLFTEIGQGLEVLKLKWLDASFEDFSVQSMVQNCPNLERVKLERCRKIGEKAVTALSGLQKLQHLSLRLSQEVSTEALCSLISERGSGLRTLSLKTFIDADDSVLDAIHNHCFALNKLRVSENDTATDSGYVSLFTDWQNPALSFVDFNSTRDVDNNNPHGPECAIGMASEGFKAMMAHSGSQLRHLDVASCRHVELSAFMDVFNGTQVYPMLEHINVSFCKSVDTSVIVGIFKSCPALKKLVAFGCFDVQEVVVPKEVVVIGIPRAGDAIEQLGVGIDVDDAISRMVEVAA